MSAINPDLPRWELRFGKSGRFPFEIDPSRVQAHLVAPAPLADVGAAVRQALDLPLDFPPLVKLFTPGDRVVLALDRNTPAASTIIAEVWKVMSSQGVAAEDVLILEPAGWREASRNDPRSELPPDVRQAVAWEIHDPTQASQLAYLAATASGERVYLSRRIVDADVNISIGSFGYDPVIGYRGTGSVYYPGMSSTDALSRAHGISHSELALDDERPLRQFIDEVAWLLGTQFTIQVVPSFGTGVCAVLAGAIDAVNREGREILAQKWLVKVAERAPLVIAAVETDAAGHGWDQIGAALAAVRNLVTKGGNVALLTQLENDPGPGVDLIRHSRSPRNAIQPLSHQAPPDWIAATHLAVASDWARVFLLSHLPRGVVDSLFINPLDNLGEVSRLLSGHEPCIILESAQHVCGAVDSD